MYQGGSYLKSRARGQTVQWPIPASAIVKIVDRWIHDQSCDPQAAFRQLSVNCGRSDVGRTVYRLRNEQTWVAFATADMLVCGTYGPQLWRTEPDLVAALEWLDQQTGPYCPECWDTVDRCGCAAAA